MYYHVKRVIMSVKIQTGRANGCSPLFGCSMDHGELKCAGDVCVETRYYLLKT